MLGTTPPYVAPSTPVPLPSFATYFPSFLPTTYPNAVDGDGVLIWGSNDAQELWIKSGSIWVEGDPPGSQRMTMEYRPTAKRIIDDQTGGGDPRLGTPDLFEKRVIATTGLDAGKLALIGLLGFLLLRGAVR
jgi:hypothetical protein